MCVAEGMKNVLLSTFDKAHKHDTAVQPDQSSLEFSANYIDLLFAYRKSRLSGELNKPRPDVTLNPEIELISARMKEIHCICFNPTVKLNHGARALQDPLGMGTDPQGEWRIGSYPFNPLRIAKLNNSKPKNRFTLPCNHLGLSFSNAHVYGLHCKDLNPSFYNVVNRFHEQRPTRWML